MPDRDTCGEARYLILFNGETRGLMREENVPLARRTPSINRRNGKRMCVHVAVQYPIFRDIRERIIDSRNHRTNLYCSRLSPYRLIIFFQDHRKM